MHLESTLIEIAALKSEREADKHEIRSLRARVAELEAAGTALLDAYRADVDAGLKHIFGIPPGPDPAFAAERLARAVDAFAVLLNR